jgi:hypothetical protein
MPSDESKKKKHNASGKNRGILSFHYRRQIKDLQAFLRWLIGEPVQYFSYAPLYRKVHLGVNCRIPMAESF